MKSPLVLIAALVFLAIAVLVTILLLPAPPAAERTTASSSSGDAKTRAAVDSRPAYNFPVSSAESTTTAPGAAMVESFPTPVPPIVTEDSLTPRGQALGRIHDAMVTYSEEGLPVLEGYLANSDKEVRLAAIEAIKQLSVPAGADVLLAAAKKAKTPEEIKEMMEAAEFLKLPRLPAEEVRKLFNDGKLSPPQEASTPSAPVSPEQRQ
jgi:hypothetical protein